MCLCVLCVCFFIMKNVWSQYNSDPARPFKIVREANAVAINRSMLNERDPLFEKKVNV